MKLALVFCVWSASCFSGVATAASATTMSAIELLRAADADRSPGLEVYRAEITITPEGGSQENTPSDYSVVTSAANGAIVTAQTADQAGQKFLATDQGFWFFAPRTHRAIRLTPMQLLRGQASVGDISRLSFERDYTIVGNVAPWPGSTASTLKLTLKAKSEGATYAKVELELEGNGRPVSGLFYTVSGRLLKLVQFGPIRNVSGHSMIANTIYIDSLDPSEKTTVQYKAIEKASADRSEFTPEALEAQ